MASVLIPLIYGVVLVSAMLIFSHFYRRRRKLASKYEPWFTSYPERDVYRSLLNQDPPAHDALLKAALLRRAAAAVRRAGQVQEDKVAMGVLLQKGSVGDDLSTHFLQAEKELNAEIVDVMRDAATFKEGWDKYIFQTAGEMVQNERMKQIYANIPKERPAKVDAKRPSSTTADVVKPADESEKGKDEAAALEPTSSGKKAKKRK